MTKSLTYVEIDIPEFAAASDPNPVLYLMMEGADGSTTITDSALSPHTHTVTAVGSAQIDTAQFHSGSSSLLLGTTNADCLTLDGSSDFAFGTADFTISFWIRLTSTATLDLFYDSRPNGITGFYVTIYLDGGFVKFHTNGSDRITGGTAVTTGTWHEVVLQRISGSTKLYLDGAQQGSTYIDANSYLNAANRPAIGGDGFSFGSGSIAGWIDDVRVDLPALSPNSPPNSPALSQTFRFTTDVSYLPIDIAAIPSIRTVNITPAIISLGGDLGQRASVEVSFKDHKHIFASESFDSGTFWGKFRARYGLKLRGFPLRLIRGVVGDALGGMETRHYIIESTDGPTTAGEFKIIAKDVLKLADGDRAQAPPLSGGYLLADMTTTQTTEIALSPTGAGDQYYLGSGYIAIGGSEIVAYNRLGIDSFDVLLIHADGNSPTSIVDALTTPHTITANGNVTASTSQSKFGGSSIFFDGTGDFITLDGSSEFAFGTNDYCVDFWVRFVSVAGTPMLYDSRPTGTNGAYLLIYLSGAKLIVHTNSANRITGATTIVVNTWYHVAVARQGTTTRLFLNGVQDGSDTNVFTFLNGASRPAIGTDGTATANNNFSGYIDELRVTNGAARFAGTFPVPTAPYSTTGSGDSLSIIRAQFNTVAATHKAGDRVQLCVQYLGQDVANIIYDLFVTYASVDPSFITLANWTTETSTYLSTIYTALIAEPTAVATLISELIEQASLVVWWDDISQQVRLQVLRSVATSADTFDADSTMVGSLQVKEQPTKRISQVYTYFAKINPLVNAEQIDNYRSSSYAINATAEAEYGSSSIKKIFSRWIPEGGRSVADSVNSILLARFVTPPRLVAFDIMRYSGTAPALGLGYQVMGWPFQDQTGAADTVPVQIVRLNPRADIFEVEAEEVFAGADAAPSSPDRHTVLIDANTFNVNLQTMHDSLYAVATSGVTVYCTILAGVLVGSSSLGSPAFDVGTFAAGVTVDITVLGTIEGAGGPGGTGTTTTGGNGTAGGTALYTRQAITLHDASGSLWGGGGGGGAGGGGHGTGGSGGGGAGQLPASGGTTTTGGSGGLPVGGFSSPNGTGGPGGGPGLAGSAGHGDTFGAGSGGAAGNAIDGLTHVTTVGGAGDRRGGQIN